MPRRSDSTDFTTREKADKHDAIMPMVSAMFREFQELTKKKPEATLNENKVRIVNRLLREVMVVIDGEPTQSYIEALDEEGLPQNSDVLLMLGQAVAAMEAFKEKYYGYVQSRGNVWSTVN